MIGLELSWPIKILVTLACPDIAGAEFLIHSFFRSRKMSGREGKRSMEKCVISKEIMLNFHEFNLFLMCRW